jgi:hypothetical protein
MKKAEDTIWRYPVMIPLWLMAWMSFTIFISAVAAILEWTV